MNDADTLQEGATLGRYEIRRLIGRGGMGCVYEAVHRDLKKRVAIKTLMPSLSANQEARVRFLREGEAASRIRHPNVVDVTDVGAEGNTSYLVMEYLDGEDLAAMLARSGPLPVPMIADLVLQALEAIGEAHALGIVHRDLKPANLYVTRRRDQSPCVKVLDFGIAKATTGVDASLTQTSMIMGSPGYMPPEQLRSTRDAEPRSDIWALGVVMYELAAGQRPFAGETITEIALKAALEPPAPLVNVPASFAAVVYRCLEKDPARRFQHVDELAAALAPFASRSAGASMPTIVGATTPRSVAAAVPTTLGAVASQVERAPRARSRLVIVGPIVALLGAVAIVLALAVRSGDQRSAGEPAAAPAPAAAPPAAPPAVQPAPAAPTPAPPPASPVVEPPVAVDAGVAAAPADAAPARKVRPRPRRPAGSASPPPDDVENSRF